MRTPTKSEKCQNDFWSGRRRFQSLTAYQSSDNKLWPQFLGESGCQDTGSIDTLILSYTWRDHQKGQQSILSDPWTLYSDTFYSSPLAWLSINTDYRSWQYAGRDLGWRYWLMLNMPFWRSLFSSKVPHPCPYLLPPHSSLRLHSEPFLVRVPIKAVTFFTLRNLVSNQIILFTIWIAKQKKVPYALHLRGFWPIPKGRHFPG